MSLSKEATMGSEEAATEIVRRSTRIKKIKERAEELKRELEIAKTKTDEEKISWKIIHRTSQRCQNILENPAIS